MGYLIEVSIQELQHQRIEPPFTCWWRTMVYSHCHKSYSRIAIFLISQSLTNVVTDSNNSMSPSDNAPIMLMCNQTDFGEADGE